jgi:hypothetical protein
MAEMGQPLPSQDFCGTAALPPDNGHRSARLARQKSADFVAKVAATELQN